jgi:hypothetical protein
MCSALAWLQSLQYDGIEAKNRNEWAGVAAGIAATCEMVPTLHTICSVTKETFLNIIF